MKITGYRTLRTVHVWGRPIGDANGSVTEGTTEVPVLLVETDGGLTGVGLGAHADAHRIFPAVENQDPRAVTALYDRMLAHTFKAGHGGTVFGTVGAFDMALWDLKAKMAGEPLWRTLGAADRFVPGYASGQDIALDDAELAALYTGWAERGFTGAKVKGGLDTDRDVVRLGAVAEALRGNTRSPALMLDVDETWGRHQAVRLLARIENRVELTWIEEPVRRWDVAGHHAVGRAGRTAVATGENLTGLEQFRPLLTGDAVQVVQTGSVWGVTHFLRVALFAHGHDLPVSPAGYGANPLAHAAAAAPNHLVTEVLDVSPPTGLTVDQVIADGGIVLGDTPGLGITVDEAAIARLDRTAGPQPAGDRVRPSAAGLRLAAEAGTGYRNRPREADRTDTAAPLPHDGRTERKGTP
ncbi:mandelate racemase/muconate lactonizing enzyme family protein [Streptomyces odontomachi]|uniref:mandelate racemase/muconate lactonizing enzyme family protein n=1 Tax=Streptomyces odontomachi TaxID=2944940 RepID=UPI00210E66DC|nr:enolase C-terminal domain-like protein [Streptomyces sp. ODS25]